jgi:hypothetical protein
MIELAVMLVIIGVSIAGVAQIFSVAEIRRHKMTDEKRIEVIRQSFAFHIQNRGDLPCPAPMTAPPSDPEFGVEQDTSTDPGKPDSCFDQASPIAGLTDVTGGRQLDLGDGAGLTDQPVVIGTIPTRTLNLPDDYMIDSYGNRLIYAVTANQTDGTWNQSQGAISVISEHMAGPDPIHMTNIPGEATFVIASVGKNRRGATSFDGVPSAIACQGTTTGTGIDPPALQKDNENCDADAVFRSAMRSDDQSGTMFFDDRISYAVHLPELPASALTADSLIPGYPDVIDCGWKESSPPGVYLDNETPARVNAFHFLTKKEGTGPYSFFSRTFGGFSGNISATFNLDWYVEYHLDKGNIYPVNGTTWAYTASTKLIFGEASGVQLAFLMHGPTSGTSGRAPTTATVVGCLSSSAGPTLTLKPLAQLIAEDRAYNLGYVPVE